MNAHHALVSADGPPRSQCGGSGRSVMRIADVDCPGCLQLDADRRARAVEPEVPAPSDGAEAAPCDAPDGFLTGLPCGPYELKLIITLAGPGVHAADIHSHLSPEGTVKALRMAADQIEIESLNEGFICEGTK